MEGDEYNDENNIRTNNKMAFYVSFIDNLMFIVYFMV